MNWIEEIGKFIRLLTDRYSAFDEPADPQIFEEGYSRFFNKDRNYYVSLSDKELWSYLQSELKVDQLRPLALIMLYDGLHAHGNEQQNLLRKAKFILNYAMQETSSFAFQDYEYLAMIGRVLNEDNQL